MKCPDCGFENRERARFCNECGHKFNIACPKCNVSNRVGSKFCDECGHSLIESQQEPTPIKYSEPQSYTPKFLADKILTTRSSIEGERKLVSVLFADVANYTAMSEKLDPEEVHQIMDGCFKILMDEIHRYEGTISQFTGDGIMAFFGAPLSHEDHAQRACYAALAIQKAIQEYGDKVEKETGVEFKMRVGLNSGQVMVGTIGDDLRMDYSALGDTTNLAARMEQAAKPGTILLSEPTHKMVESYFEFKPLGKIDVKGKEEPQEAYELLKASDVTTRIEASAAKGLTRFVGRKNSMAVLVEAWEKAKSGAGQVVGIVGEAGVGKSRLLLEFKNKVAQECTLLQGHCLHYGSNMPYLPVLDIVKAYFGITEDDREYIVRKKVKEGSEGLDETLAETVAPFQELLSLKADDESFTQLEARQKRDRTFEALRDLFIKLSEDRPVILVIEDLHWIDNTTQEFLDYLIGWIQSKPILLILLYRPEYTHQWGSKSYYNRIGLDQLRTESSTELVKAILEGGEIAPELQDLILERAAGNPLFMEEFTHSLQENGTIQKDGDQYVLSRSISELDVPETVQGIIAARMDRLEDNLKRIMQVASVIGRDFAYRILQRISGMKEELKSYLLNLQGLEFIFEKSLFPELEYIFKHALTRDVAYNSLLQKRRKEIHEQIGLAIEELFADRLEELYEVLTYHYSMSDNQEKAIEYALLAGDQAASLYAHIEATTYYEQAITMARALPPCPKAERLQIESTLKLAAVGITRQDIQRDHKNLKEAHALAENLMDEPLLVRVLYWLGRIEYVLLNIQKAIEYGKESLKIADHLGDDILAAPPVNLMGRLYWARSELVQASQMMVRSVEQMQKLGNKTEESTAAGFAGQVFAHLGKFDQAFIYADHSLQLARETQNPFAESAAYHLLGIDKDQYGEWAQAIEAYEQGRAIAENVGDIFRVHLIKLWEGRAYTFIGDPNQGRVLLDESLALGNKIGTKFGFAGLKIFRAMCLNRLADLDAAFSDCQEAIHLCDEDGNKAALALALRTLGEIIFCQEPLDAERAERSIQQAIRLQQEIEANPELARSYVSYAKLLKIIADNEEAEKYLSRAIDMFRHMGMKWDLVQAEQASRNV